MKGKMKGKPRKKKTVLEKIEQVNITVTGPREIHTVRPINLSVPGFTTETTEIGVAEICKEKAMYLRLSLRSDY
jgi:hypothetical protein